MKYGRYEISKTLGKGSMGVVYQAHDPHIDRPVALKVMREDRLSSTEFVQRFLKEAKAIGRLSHPGIVTVHDVGEDQGTVYIAMEFLDGTPLNEMIGKDLTIPTIVDIGIQVAEALDYAHTAAVVHRDIKPSNLILKPNGQVKITDFGIAHLDDPNVTQQTQAGEILGTPAYMSPEQVLGRPVDGRSDLYSLGIILYELCTGERPFKGQNIATVLRAITEEVPPEPVEINPAIVQELSQVIMRCLSKAPEDRFTTGKALAEALRNSLREKEKAPVPEVRPRSKRTWKVVGVIGLAIVGLLVAGVSAFLVVKHRGAGGARVESHKYASLQVQSAPPGAKVFVDGSLKGGTPLKLELPVGKHEVRVDLANHFDWAAEVFLQEGGVPLNVHLLPMD